MKADNPDIFMQNRIIVLVAAATGLILLVPLIAGLFSDDMTWSAFDFAAMGVVLFSAGLASVFAARKLQNHRLIAGLIVGAALLYVWAELAVGVFTNLGS